MNCAQKIHVLMFTYSDVYNMCIYLIRLCNIYMYIIYYSYFMKGLVTSIYGKTVMARNHCVRL